jgi:pimeloyl-ACP methyl ester carboxylesterase
MLTPIVFSHGNSFPACTYRQVFNSLNSRGFDVQAVEKFGHDSQYPVSDNWPHLVQQLADFVRTQHGDGPAPFLVGHSLGGILSLMCAAKHPELARGVLLLDSPILAGWKATTLGLAKRTPLVGSLSPGRISSKRRNHWASRELALEHFQHKKAFAQWDPLVLQDYIQHGTTELDGQIYLSFDRDVETRIYNTLPHNLGELLRKHPLQCPVAFIGGTHSVEMRQVGMELTQRITKGRVMMLDGSHLFPMEKPLATAAAIEAALRNLGA